MLIAACPNILATTVLRSSPAATKPLTANAARLLGMLGDPGLPGLPGDVGTGEPGVLAQGDPGLDARDVCPFSVFFFFVFFLPLSPPG